jgi:glycosyltransferase involved in cell wall biosynthesis
MTRNPAKIVHFSTVHPATDARVFHKECLSLHEAGFDVTLYARCQADAVVSGVQVRRVDEFTGRFRRIAFAPLVLVRRLMKERADLYHFHDPELLPLGIVLRIFGKRVVYDAHEWVRGDVGSKPYLSKPVAKALSGIVGLVEQVSSRMLSHVVAATPFIAAQFPIDRVTVIHNYPDLSELGADSNVPWSDREPAVAYVGGLNDERCGRQLLEAVDLLVASKSGIRLLVAGTVDDGIDPTGHEGVDYLGVISRTEVAALLQRVRCGVVLLSDLRNFQDSMPTKFFEYLAAGLPVVVSSSARLVADLATELGCGVAVDATDPKDIAIAIARVVESAGEAERMGLLGKAAVLDRFNWATESGRLVQLYDRLLS